MKIYVCNVMNGLVGLSGHQRRGRGQKCRGGAHEDPQNAQKSTSTGVPQTTLKNIEKKKKKNDECFNYCYKPSK